MKLIVGLGNPGKEYEKTRHNVGWRILDAFNLDFRLEKKFNAEVAKHAGLLFCKPQTFMNNSGQAVRELMDYYHIPVENLLVIYDDKDLPFGTIRLRSTGSSGGHNGMQSLIQHLGTQNFGRVRIGVSADSPIQDTAQFVLQRFSAHEEHTLPQIITLAKKAITDILDVSHPVQHQDISLVQAEAE